MLPSKLNVLHYAYYNDEEEDIEIGDEAEEESEDSEETESDEEEEEGNEEAC